MAYAVLVGLQPKLQSDVGFAESESLEDVRFLQETQPFRLL